MHGKRKEREPDDGSRKNGGICPYLPVAFAGNRKTVKTEIPVP